MSKAIGILGFFLLLGACSAPPKPTTPGLTPQAANEALATDSKAKGWLEHARKMDPSCEYILNIPDQSSHPTELDFKHIMNCGGRQSPLELDASVSFEWDPDTQHWVIKRFSD